MFVRSVCFGPKKKLHIRSLPVVTAVEEVDPDHLCALRQQQRYKGGARRFFFVTKILVDKTLVDEFGPLINNSLRFSWDFHLSQSIKGESLSQPTYKGTKQFWHRIPQLQLVNSNGISKIDMGRPGKVSRVGAGAGAQLPPVRLLVIDVHKRR